MSKNPIRDAVFAHLSAPSALLKILAGQKGEVFGEMVRVGFDTADQHIAALNDTVIAQQEQIEQLKLDLHVLRQVTEALRHNKADADHGHLSDLRFGGDHGGV